MASGGVRITYLGVYAGFAALSAGLLARPSLLYVRSLGLLGPVLPWTVPAGGAALVLTLLLCAFTLRLAGAFALGRKLRVPEHALFLLLVGAAISLRAAAGEPIPPASPDAALLDGLRTAAEALDRGYARAQRYQVDDALGAALAAQPSTPFRYRGRALPLRARSLEPQGTALPPGARPGDICVRLSPDGKRAWISALTLRDGQLALLPTTLQARAGTHGAPGRDPLIPAYPGMRPAIRER